MLWRWASKDSRSKTDYDIAADSVTISTVHSVKGLDFACVFLVGFDFLEPGSHWTDAQMASLAYVAITRARTRLYVPYDAGGVGHQEDGQLATAGAVGNARQRMSGRFFSRSGDVGT